ncbi:MAG: GIY-YIG nuclease family protein [Saprospiraceae bacterium]|nr:GIY-YIG nuclease family protein [Saprospiraceae bacterium]
MARKKQFTEEDDALLEALGVTVEPKKTTKYTPREQRIIAGFEELQKFVEEHGRLPTHGEDKDIFERLYAVRLDRIRSQQECRELLEGLDSQNLLAAESDTDLSIPDDIDDEELLKQLGVDTIAEESITNLKHVKSRSEKRAAEEIANRTKCEDFDQFKPLFEMVKKQLDAGVRETIRFRKDAGFTKTQLKQAQFLIVGGQMTYIAEVGKPFKAPNGEEDARLRVIYANGTESNILLRSLMRAMYKDDTSRFITDPNLGPLFSGQKSEEDQESGTIYVLRSLSNHPKIQKNQGVVHKIGVTGSDVKTRIANAKNDPTFLMADVEIVATYKLVNINRVKLEKILHRFFDSVRLEIEVIDRFGKPVNAREWFLVPLFIIDEVVEKIKAGTISDYFYDSNSAQLRR